MSESIRIWVLRASVAVFIMLGATALTQPIAQADGCKTQMSWDTSTWDSKIHCPRTVSKGSFQDSESQLPEWCSWREATPEEMVKFGTPQGVDQSKGKLLILGCGADPSEAGRDAGQGGSAFADIAFVENDPPPDPAVLAQEAYTKLAIPAPVIGIGPHRDQYVQLPTWLWVDDPGQLVSTVEAGGVSVTATASLDSTIWTLGEPDRNPSFTGFRPGPAMTMTCQGAGTPPPADVDWKAEPPCGHTFRWRSLPERTGGSGEWPITATTSWTVTWQSNTGQSGSGTLTATSQDAVAVGEYRILLVDGGR